MDEIDLGIEGLTVQELIGRGGFGAVYRVTDDVHGRELAVKVLPPLQDASARRQFDRERRAMGALSDHPGIGTVHTSGFTPNAEPYIAMQLMSGGSLADRIAQGPLPVADTLAIGISMADALGAAHDAGVLHLDIKPENILFTSRGEPKLVDFGIAKLADDARATSTIRATPAFAAPEVLEGQEATPAADVYGLAVTLYAALVGHAPFSGDSMLTVLRRIAIEPTPEITRPDVPADLVSVLRKAMDKSPALRTHTMPEFAEQRRGVQGGAATTGSPVGDSPTSTVTFGAAVPFIPTPSGAFTPPPPPSSTPSGAWTSPPNPSGPVPPNAASGVASSSGYSGPPPTNNPPPPANDPPPPGDVPYQPPKQRPMGAIIGGVAAAVVLVILVGVLLTRGGDDGGAGGPTTDARTETTDAPPGTTDAPPGTTEAPTGTLEATVTTAAVADPPPPTTTTPAVDTAVLPSVTDQVWGNQLDASGVRAVPTGSYFPDGTIVICTSWNANDFPVGTPWSIAWTRDGIQQPHLSASGTTLLAGSEPFYACAGEVDGSPIVPGLWEMRWNTDNELAMGDSVYVGGGRPLVTSTLINGTGIELCQLNVTPTPSTAWGRNALSVVSLQPDAAVDYSHAAGQYDILGVDCDGNQVSVQTFIDFESDGQFVIADG